ncbi:hypothetical protein BGX26_010983 [Mortierella sp. AD094]|nr:hypothetical protein BGX26_010983 [Mortierella sp. AD094]
MTYFQCCQSYTRLLARAARPQSLRQTLFASTASVPKTANTASFHTSTSCYSQSGKRNHYEQLNLTRSATKKEIKTQFYKLSKLHHPDKNASEESRKKFLLINEAYSVLGDERLRRDYDLIQLDKSGTLYSDSSSHSPPSRGTLRRTPFRHSPQSAAAAAAAAAAARSRVPFRPNFGEGVAHFDSKSHQEMHYEQEIRREERRQARERASAEYQSRKQYEDSDSSAGRVFRVFFVFMTVVAATSFMKTFADEGDGQERGDLNHDLDCRYNRQPLRHDECLEDEGLGSDDSISTVISSLRARSTVESTRKIPLAVR